MITVVVVIIATMLGVSISSIRYTKKIEALFFDGIYLKDEGYTQPGMYSHIRNCADAALGLATVMASRPEFAHETGALITTQQVLMDAFSLSNINSAYIRMTDSYNILISAITGIELSEREITAIERYSSLLSGAQKAMVDSRYNSAVTEYMDGRSALMRVIGLFVPTKTPHFFDFPDA